MRRRTDTRGWKGLLFLLLVGLSLAACGGDNGFVSDFDDDDSTDQMDDDDDGETASRPTTFPALAEVGLYSAGSPFNTPIGANPVVDAGSQTMIDQFTDAGEFVIQVGQYSTAVYFADENTQRVDVEILCGPVWELGIENMLSIPIPEYATPSNDVDGAENPPVGCGEESDQDNNMVVLDLDARCEYDFWQARGAGSSWAASWGNSMDLDDDGVHDTGMSIRGSGFSFLGGLIWPDELINGRIDHVLVASYPFTRSGGPVPPATDSDGVTDGDQAIPPGAVLQLDPDLDLSTLGLTSYETTIATAMQEYGLMIVDTGGGSGIGLYAIDPSSIDGDMYQGSIPDEDFVTLPNIPLDQFRVLELGEQDADWADSLDPGDSSCHTWG